MMILTDTKIRFDVGNLENLFCMTTVATRMWRTLHIYWPPNKNGKNGVCTGSTDDYIVGATNQDDTETQNMCGGGGRGGRGVYCLVAGRVFLIIFGTQKG